MGEKRALTSSDVEDTDAPEMQSVACSREQD